MQNTPHVAAAQDEAQPSFRFASPLNRARPKAHGVLVLAALVVAAPTHLSNLIGVALICLGAGIRLWASGYLRKSGKLCTAGPYAHVRHPLYLGTMVMALGFGVLINQWQRWYLTPILLATVILLYVVQIVLEERSLRRHYGADYREYARMVPALLPRLRRASADPGNGFEWSQVLRNREHLRALWALFAVVLFVVKTELVRAGLSWLSPLSPR